MVIPLVGMVVIAEIVRVSVTDKKQSFLKLGLETFDEASILV